MFAYCGNDPISYADPAGQYPLQSAFELLDMWIDGDGEEQHFTKKDRLTKRIKRSAAMQEKIKMAIDAYKDGRENNDKFVNFEPDDDYELYLAAHACSYTISVSEETRTVGFWLWKHEEVRYVATVEVSDTYNFDKTYEWDSFGHVMNNLAYIYNCFGGGKDYDWDATFTYETEWTPV